MVELRSVLPEDIERFFEHQLDATASWMAASTSANPADRAAFGARWERNLAEPTIVLRTIAYEGQAVGYVASFLREGTREVAYWLGRSHWGRGIATAALERLLTELQERPLHARVVEDNVASLRVLEKCGFLPVGRDRFHSRARGCEVDEVVLSLR